MLKELTRQDWLSILNIPERRVPLALLLRGTRNLKHWYQLSQQHFTNILEVGTPNGVLDDLFIGDLAPYPVAYASVYGAPMASEIVHVFGMLGTRLVIQIGNCGALADEMIAGDLFSASEAYCGEGASQYYTPGKTAVPASLDPRKWISSERLKNVTLHRGRIYTTSALFAEGADDIESWFRSGYSAVDLETAATFAVAKYFGMDRTSIVYAFDNPRQKDHILLNDAEKAKRRIKGNELMMQLALDVIQTYASRK
jgi:uridine phosphorylase